MYQLQSITTLPIEVFFTLIIIKIAGKNTLITVSVRNVGYNDGQDLRNCHKQWRGVTAPRAKQLHDKHGNSRTF